MFKRFLVASAFVGLSAVTVQAASISVSIFDAVAYNGSFGQFPNLGEDFETLGAQLGEGEVGADFETAVGTFNTIGGTGTGGTVNNGGFANSGTELALRDGNVYGRTNNTPINGNWFLDSNDTWGLHWDVSIDNLGFNALSFVLQDGSDVGAYLRISALDTNDNILDSEELRTGGKLPNGNAKVVVIDFGQTITNAQVHLGNYTSLGGNNFRKNDGFSIDGLQVTAVPNVPTNTPIPTPLPASVLLLGAGMVGLGALRRFKRS